MGSDGAKFIAQVELTREGQEPEMLFPAVMISEGRLIPEPVQIEDNLELVMNRINANDGSAYFQFDAVHPFIPMQVFYKPLVWLVWARHRYHDLRRPAGLKIEAKTRRGKI